MRIEYYKINDDLTVDVDGDVNISNKKLNYIPIKFVWVKGNFSCARNQLTTLNGCPYKIEGNFSCNNNLLTSLKYSPHKTINDFSCSNNKLKSLEYLPNHIINLSCENNPVKNYDIFDDIHIENSLIFTPNKDMSYLNNYKDENGDILMTFNDF